MYGGYPLFLANLMSVVLFGKGGKGNTCVCRFFSSEEM